MGSKFKYAADIGICMNGLQWGTRDASRTLEELTRQTDFLTLHLVEIAHGNSALYELHVVANERIAIVDLGTYEKNTQPAECYEHWMADAASRRGKIARILRIPSENYSRDRACIAEAFAKKHLHGPADNHLNPSDERDLVNKIVQCAYSIGFSRIKKIGNVETTPDMLEEARDYLFKDPLYQIEELCKRVHDRPKDYESIRGVK